LTAGSSWWRWAIVFGVPATLVAAFAWCAGWLSSRLTAPRIVDAFEATTSPHPGFRRNHAKGICVTGHFESNGAALAVSHASVFEPGRYDVTGRLSFPGSDPAQDDRHGMVRSFAMKIALPHGEEWRLAMNSTPIFAVRTPQALFEQLEASARDPRTGRPDPAKMEAFDARHPEVQAFHRWVDAHPPSSRYGNARYYGISAFKTVDTHGAAHFVRWDVVPDSPYRAVDDATQRDPDFLEHELVTQLSAGPLRWHLMLDVALPGDPTDDSTRQWADTPQRERIDAGTVVIDRAQTQIDGPCRDITFDPTVLPDGIAPSSDPLLAARSSAYRVSSERRLQEEASAQRNGS
jgi:catalase